MATFQQPETINTGRINGGNASRITEFVENRAKILKAATNWANQNRYDNRPEKELLLKAIGSMDKMQALNKYDFEELEKNEREFEDEETTCKPKKAAAEVEINGIQRKIDGLREGMTKNIAIIQAENAKRDSFAQKINPHELAATHIKDKKSSTNELFKWVLNSIYGETLANYDWSNFKKQAFGVDKGLDFTQRIKGLNLCKLKLDHDLTVHCTSDDGKKKILDEGASSESVRALFDYITSAKKAVEALSENNEHHTTIEGIQAELDKKKLKCQELENQIETAETKLRVIRKMKSTITQSNEFLAQNIELAKDRLKKAHNFKNINDFNKYIQEVAPRSFEDANKKTARPEEINIQVAKAEPKREEPKREVAKQAIQEDDAESLEEIEFNFS